MFIAKEGWPFIVIPLAIGALFIFLLPGRALHVFGWLMVLLGLFCAFFFRDPAREIPQDEGLVISPCDGTVMEVTSEGGQKVIRVFLSVLNVHLQRSPVAGTVKSVEYRPGRFLPAMKPEAHEVNEQNIITIESPRGKFVVKQIAGILARRVVAWCRAGDRVEKGQKIGLIKFGSQVDLHLPENADIKVKTGDRVKGGETVFAQLR